MNNSLAHRILKINRLIFGKTKTAFTVDFLGLFMLCAARIDLINGNANPLSEKSEYAWVFA
ncbi:MAG: hypothetical protein K2O04_04570 [Clostridiales bacterium]|nr:hypothetical protein [Clostridiales bacterium]